MHRFKRFFKTGLKVAGIGAVSSAVFGYGYLQYVNSKLGPITLDYDEAMTYYKQKHEMSDTKAHYTYYFALWNLSLSRIINYRSYTWYCDKFNRKVIDFSLTNYRQTKILEEIEKAGSFKSNKSVHEKLYKRIKEIRKKNS